MSVDLYTIFWDEVEGSAPEEYNEAFLAAVRDDLKRRERSNAQPVYIEPRFYSGKTDFWACAEKRDSELFAAFTAAMVHTARRLKDCERIAGFVLPDFDRDWAALCICSDCTEKADEAAARALYIDSFKQAFAKKYSHYEFISR
ncbi:hypothetical protein V1L52_03290 [Treponema sp. HNW]|uniref:hypothetical protein n=1 Tax=Treponema sp. HNW TaxID=3116654 RepID=UPI003D10E058